MKQPILRLHLDRWYFLPCKTSYYSACLNCGDNDYTFLCFTLQLK